MYLGLNANERVITNEVEGNIKGDNKDITVSDTHNTNLLVPGEIKVKYIDKETGEEIIDEETTSKLVGEKYTPEDKEIEGYKLVERPEEREYEYMEETQVLRYYYQRTKVKVNTKANEGGTIEGDEDVYYGEDSTVDKIRIKADPGYVIDKIKINGKEIEVPENSSELTLSNFVKMTEDKLVEVSFKKKAAEVVNVPITSSFISKVVLAIGTLLIALSSVIIYKKTRNI